MSTLRQRQFNALKQMLNLNQPITKSIASEPTWKVLVYDRVGQDIISPLMSIKELRELGVTLHVQLHSDRDTIPEVPAVYFCAPTEENLGRICQDLDNGIYDQYHLNFISPITRQKLEDLAASAIQSNSAVNIHKIYDQYLNFICLEDDLFIMKHQQSDPLSYYAINKGDTKDTEMEAIMDNIVESLFSVFVTLGNVPIIRSSKGNAAEMVAKKLDKKLRENLWDARNNLFHGNTGQTGAFSFTRPMLILLDRNIDMATPLHHTWTYQALAHDVLDLSLNRAMVPESLGSAVGGSKSKVKVCDLDSKDPLWQEHKGSPFPTVAEAIQEDLDKYRSSEAEVKKLKSSMGLDADSDLALSMVSDNTQRLTSAVNSLPQLMEKKRLIDMHTTIATAILNAIKSRRLDSFFELEEKIMSKSSAVESKTVLDLISDPSAGVPEDKMRLFIIYYLCTSQMPEEEYKKFEAALLAAECDVKPMAYMRRWKGFSKMSSQYEGGGTKTVSMFSKLVSQGSSFVMEGVKNLVVKKHKLPVSRTVEDALHVSSTSAEPSSELSWLDPRAARTDAAARARAAKHPPPTDAVVFVVGGGNYIEYHNLIDFAKQAASGTTRKIIYGATTLPNASQFLKQLSLLGEEIQ
ncbi:protein sly1 homolog isoform X2 [Plodia interpunctella]|uniref:protein sly1 homolog isoform X2 n=1 Tax=Plodia interpunctella TaxID=58824 RepID=UPI002367BC65|nr:protein sly1 homolog isoform X2 [Plodia interpunctella]